jgi:RNA polymerase sigma-70 factor, ECF subfamily
MFDSDVRTETDSTSPSLIRLVKAGHSAAWQRLARLYGPLVHRWARQAGLQDCDAADVLQQVFRAVFNGIGRFHHGAPNDSFRGWLGTEAEITTVSG